MTKTIDVNSPVDASSNVGQLTDALQILKSSLSSVKISNQVHGYYAYSDDENLQLQAKIDQLISSLDAVKADLNDGAKDDLDTQKKRALLAAYQLISAPNQENYNTLRKVANEVNGRGSRWEQVGLVLLAILSLLLIPTLVLIPATMTVFQYADTGLRRAERQGLSAAADSVASAVRATEAFKYNRDITLFGYSDKRLQRVTAEELKPTAPSTEDPAIVLRANKCQ